MSKVPPLCSCGRIKGTGHICPRLCSKCGKEYAAKACLNCFPVFAKPTQVYPHPHDVDRAGKDRFG